MGSRGSDGGDGERVARLANDTTMTLTVGIFLALACALATNLGFLYKHRGACAAPAVDIRRPIRSARALFASRWFTIGMLVAVGAWILHVAALAMAPMSVVQAVLAGGVVLLAIMAERIFGLSVGPRQWAGLLLTAAGLVLLGVTLPAVHGAQSNFSLAGMISFEAGLLAVGVLLIMGRRMGAPGHHHGVMLGAAAGILFGVSDIAIKALTGMIGSAGPLGIVSPWLIVTLIASIAAFYASARGLQDGDAVPVIAVTGAAANVAGIAGGIIVFGDPLPGSVLGMALQATAFALVIVAAWLTPAPVRAARVGAAPA
jgi:drug/metabolite transporter (DMT)-like permease